MNVMKILDINGIVRECDNIVPDDKFPGYLKVDFLSKRDPHKRITEWFPIEDFKRLNPSLTDLVTTASVAEDTLGVVSGSTSDTIKDKTKSWKPDCYIGFTVWISRGTGEGQTRIVTTNTKNSLTIDKPWNIKPDKTSQYVVSLHVHNPTSQGNTLP